MQNDWGSGSHSRRLKRIVGVPAVLVLGFGAIVIGEVLLGLIILGIGVCFAGMTLSQTKSRKALWFGCTGAILGVLFALNILSDEVSGKTYYHKKGQPTEAVTRDESPEKFRSSIRGLCQSAIFFSIAGFAGFSIYFVCRKSDRRIAPPETYRPV